MDGRLVVERGTIFDFLALVLRDVHVRAALAARCACSSASAS